VKAFRLAAMLVCIALAGYVFYRLVLHVRAPVIPAIIDRTADAHRMLASSLDARINRYLYDRPPADRSGSPRLVALTFDDGPYPVETPLLLDVLHDLHVPATFFLIGRDAEEFPQLTRRIAAAGHEIANHTLTHPSNFEELGTRAVQWQLEGGADALETMVRDPSIRKEMRPPHGRFTEATVRAAQAAGYSVVLWNDDPGDWRSVPAAMLVTHIERSATAPDIILLHSGRLGTIEMLPEIVARFRKAGFTFVTARDLLRRVPHTIVNHPAKTPL
jgi:peptidoglycan/xylan/chitin deacetylase (PgdA/CDA1 family)